MTRRFAAFLVGLGALAGCAGAEPATSFDAVELNGGAVVSSESLRGQPALLLAWATWCTPCLRELPAVEQALPEIEAAGVQVVAVNVDVASMASDDEVAAELDELAPSLTSWRDDDSTILAVYGGAMMPFSVLLDADGEVAESWTGAFDPDGSSFSDALAER